MPTSIHGTNGITFNDGSTQNTRPAVGYRNRIINGDVRIWQRATSFSVGSTSFTYTADRFKAFSINTSTTVSRSTSVPNGFQYSYQLQRPNGNTGTNPLLVTQIIETANCYDLAGQPVTLSFWVKKGANYSGTNLTVTVNTGTVADEGGNPFAFTGLATAINDSGYAPTTTWSKVTFTGTVASNVLEAAVAIQFVGTGTAGADDSIYITGVQLEIGSTATEFERRPIGTELALCQRYYDKSYSMDVAPNTVTKAGLLLFSTESYVGGWYMGGASIRFSAEMRRVPDFTYIDSDGTAGRVNAFYNGATNGGANPPFTFYVSKKSVAISQTGINVGGSAGSPLLAHYTANAEL
jgi:hypothetical protein